LTEKRPDAGYLLICYSNPDNGFFALVSSVLNGVQISLESNLVPVVKLDQHASDFFYEPSVGDNIWEYYFEPVQDIGSEAFHTELTAGRIDPGEVQVLDSEEESFRLLSLTDPGRIAHFWVGEDPSNPGEWLTAKRALGRDFVGRFVKVKSRILGLVDEFETRHFQSTMTYGVHIRGTDFGYATPIHPERYFEAIREKIAADNPGDFRVFLATDQQQFVTLFKEEFPGRVLTYDAYRSCDEKAPFQMNSLDNYKKGEDVLVDALLLSRCHYLFKGPSAVGEYALWFNPKLECHDFALESQWDSSHYASAALKMNLENLHPLIWRSKLLYRALKRVVLDAVLKLSRRLLPKKLRHWLWMKIGRHLYFQ
jgi:hypothetical protein